MCSDIGGGEGPGVGQREGGGGQSEPPSLRRGGEGVKTSGGGGLGVRRRREEPPRYRAMAVPYFSHADSTRTMAATRADPRQRPRGRRGAASGQMGVCGSDFDVLKHAAW